MAEKLVLQIKVAIDPKEVSAFKGRGEGCDGGVVISIFEVL